MAEMPDVQIGETIAVEWGNAIRDRTIQRYADAAERDELHPTPTEGDLSYLEDTNSIEVYDGFAWVAGIPNQATTTAKIADGAVTTARIADGAVTNQKIAADAITAFERSGATVQTDVDIPSSVGDLAVVNLDIPHSWSSWECVAFAQTTATPLVNFADVRLRVRIDGTDGPEFQTHLPVGAGGPRAAVAASFRSGITTTGNRTIRLRGFRGPDTPARLKTVFLYARAFRTS